MQSSRVTLKPVMSYFLKCNSFSWKRTKKGWWLQYCLAIDVGCPAATNHAKNACSHITLRCYGWKVNIGDLLFVHSRRAMCSLSFSSWASCLQSELNEATAPQKDPKREVNCDHKGQRSHKRETFWTLPWSSNSHPQRERADSSS